VTQRSPDGSRMATLGNRIGPPRFLLFLVLLPAAFLAHRTAFPGAHWGDAAAMAFDGAALVFLASLVPLLRDADPATIRAQAAANDANRLLVLVLTTLIGFAVMAAIAGELPAARAGQAGAAIKLVVTLALIWLFANSVFTLHYAHAWYARVPGGEGDAGGIAFPGTAVPGYGDFAYFAFTLGMTFQTSDVEITAPAMRRIALLHSLGAFVFNIGVIAFAINALGGAAG
jgi:uncharacterized membrane protein